MTAAKAAAPMSPWLRSMLVVKGVMDSQGVTRKARIRRHRACGMPVIAGFDAPCIAWSTWVDLTELSRRGELAALLDGRRTYELWPVAGGFELEYRGRDRIRHRPADTPGTPPVLCTHRCDAYTPRDWSASRPSSIQRSIRPLPDIPPF